MSKKIKSLHVVYIIMNECEPMSHLNLLQMIWNLLVTYGVYLGCF